MVKDAARATAVGADIVEVRLDKLWVIEQEKKPDEDIKSDNDCLLYTSPSPRD